MLSRGIYTRRQPRLSRQGGVALMELLIAAAIGLIAISGMLMLMANTFSTGSKTIRMTGLTEEMRTAMQIMSRELRRANYHGSYAACFNNESCIAELGISGVVTDINIGGAASDCFWFWYDRPQGSSTPVGIGSEQVAAFRRTTNSSGVGLIEMTVAGTAAPNCNDDSANWQAITNPDSYDITGFRVTDNLSFTSAVTGAGAALSVNRIGIAMMGRLVNDPSLPAWMGGTGTPTVRLSDFIRVRNDIPNPPGP